MELYYLVGLVGAVGELRAIRSFSSAQGAASPSSGSSEPLASRMRPRTLDEFVGQEHIVGPGRLLRRAIQKDQLSSILLSGPPGTGKTTLARVIANTTASRFVTLNAVLAGVADIRSAIDEAKKQRDLYDRRTMLFVDEVHRWNKAQQDALLPWVENGTLLLIGATTENPFFEVNRALVSRSRVFQLKALDSSDLLAIGRAALADPNGATAHGGSISRRARSSTSWRPPTATRAASSTPSSSRWRPAPSPGLPRPAQRSP